jgi:hypothetical protein
VVGGADPETFLRLACERLLLSRHRRGGLQQGGDAPVIGRALIAAGLLERAEVDALLEEYLFAFGLREQGGWWHTHRMGVAVGQGRRLSAQRVVAGQLAFGAGDERMTLERVVFGDDETEIELSGLASSDRGHSAVAFRGNPMSRMRMRQIGPVFGRVLAVRDDQGTTASASGGRGGSSGREWHAQFTTDVPLSAASTWIEIDGVRIELPEWRPVAEVRIEPVEPLDPLRAMLYGEILGAGSRHGGDASVAVAIETLVAMGALPGDDPMVGEVSRIEAAFNGGGSGTNLPYPWSALVGRMSKSDGPLGTLPIGAVVEALEGCSIRIDSLTSEKHSFSVALAVSPGAPLLFHFPGIRLDRSPIDWWAEDNRQNVYFLISGSGSGSDEVAEGTIESMTPLDPKATELRLLPTGAQQRAVVAIQLAELGGNR